MIGKTASSWKSPASSQNCWNASSNSIHISASLPLLSRMYPSLMWRRMKRSGEILAPQGQNRQSFAGTERILRLVCSFTASTNCLWHQDNQLASRPHFCLSMVVRVQLTTAGQWVFQSRKFFVVERYANMLCLQWKKVTLVQNASKPQHSSNQEGKLMTSAVIGWSQALPLIPFFPFGDFTPPQSLIYDKREFFLALLQF